MRQTIGPGPSVGAAGPSFPGPQLPAGGIVPRKEHVTLRRLTLGSRRRISCLAVAGLFVAMAAVFGHPRWLKVPFLRHGALAGVAATTHIEKYWEPPP